MNIEESTKEEDIEIVEHLKAIYDIVKTKCMRCYNYYGCMGCTLSPGDGLMGYLHESVEMMSMQSATANNKIKELFPDRRKSFFSYLEYSPCFTYCNSTILEVLKGNITKIQVDAIVSAAGNSLLGGGGLSGAIHFAGGPELIEECRTLNGCETGKAKITKGYKLPAKYVIHTVGPRWRNSKKKEFILWGDTQEVKLLKSCYTNILDLAKENDIKTIAIPAISCGAYGFPIDKATEIALATVKNYVKKYPGFKKIIFIDKNQEVIQEYKDRL